MRKLLTAFILSGAVVVAGCVSSQTSTAQNGAEMQEMTQAVDQFSRSFRAGDWPGVINMIPPQMLYFMASGPGRTTTDPRRVITREISASMEGVKILRFALDKVNATYGETPIGRPYSLIPSTVVMADPDVGQIRIESITLVMMEAGKWYVVRPSDFVQDNSFHKIYPDFEGIRFPAAKTTQIGN